MNNDLGKIVEWDNTNDVNKLDMGNAMEDHRFGTGSDPDCKHSERDRSSHTGHIDQDGRHFGGITDREQENTETHIYRRDD